MSTSNTITRISNPFAPIVPKSKNLWHLAGSDSTEKKLRTFLRGGLWFARLDTFASSVPEGTLPKQNVGLLTKLPRFQIKMVKKIYKLAVRRSFASCWHMSDGDPSTYAWQTFGGNGDGIAIRTTPALLQSAVSVITGNDGPVHFGQVRYIDYWVEVIPEGNEIEAAFVVQNIYCHEREARILIHSHGTAAADYLAHKDGPFGPLVKRPPKQQLDAGNCGFLGGHSRWKAIVAQIDPALLIQEIVIGPNMNDSTRKRIVDLVARHGLAYRCLN